MTKKLYLLSLGLVLCMCTLAQQQPDKNALRIVDTLSVHEKTSRSPILLRSELDSLIAQYKPVATISQPVEKPEAKTELQPYLLGLSSIALVFIAGLLFILFRNQKRFSRTVGMLNKQIQHLEQAAYSSGQISNQFTSNGKQKAGTAIEKNSKSIQTELEKLKKENISLGTQLKEVKSIQRDFDTVKQQMTHVYKMRNYPGFTSDKSETDVVKDLLDTESSVAIYSYEHFLKPVIAIADKSKNSPTKMTESEKKSIVSLLLSLSLLYSEYLYLRVNELSVGGNMVQRISALKNGSTIDTTLLKQLSLEHGSRALAIRMALDEIGVEKLSYPVFDETNLNPA